MTQKKPDNVAWDEKDGKYVQSILPYGSNVSAPAIVLDDVAGFKLRGVNKAQKVFNSKFQEIKEDYEKLIDEVKLNEMIYSSNFSFEPVIGDVYHLYERNNGNFFLSLIAPNEWNMKHIISVRLNSEHKWVFIDVTLQKK